MSRECVDCGATTAPGRRVCKDCSLEDRLGLPSDHFDADTGIVCWVQDLDETWHASMYFEGSTHVSACGEIFETPVADVRDDPRRLSETTTCDDCEAALEEDEEKAAADGGFEKASEIATDGGEIDVYQWVLDNVHEYPAGTDSRWGSRSNLVHQGRKLDGVEKADVQEAIGRAVDNEDLISWHGLLARVEVARLRELVRVEHEEHDITRQILVGKCNKLIAKKKQEEADKGAEPEVATDGGLKEVYRRETIVATDDGMAIGEDAVPEDDREVRPDGGQSLSVNCRSPRRRPSRSLRSPHRHRHPDQAQVLVLRLSPLSQRQGLLHRNSLNSNYCPLSQLGEVEYKTVSPAIFGEAPLYEYSVNTGTVRDRAQVDPRMHGVLVLVIGLLFSAAISVGVVL